MYVIPAGFTLHFFRARRSAIRRLSAFSADALLIRLDQDSVRARSHGARRAFQIAVPGCALLRSSRRLSVWYARRPAIRPNHRHSARQPSNENRPDLYRNIFQAYGRYVARIGKGLTIDFGKWASSDIADASACQFVPHS